MKQYNYFKTSEFERQLSLEEKIDVQRSPDLEGHREEIRARLNILRKDLGLPITINSWYRDKKHNEREGGVPTSQHLDGTAVDITCPDNLRLLTTLEKLIADGMDFGQIIVYGVTKIRFIHLSLPTRKALNEYLKYP